VRIFLDHSIPNRAGRNRSTIVLAGAEAILFLISTQFSSALGGCSPGELIHLLIWDAVSACRARRKSSSRAVLPLIEDLGFVAIEAENADAAVTILESRSDIDAVFTDVRMPGSMDGIQLAFLIRERWPPIKILAASGNATLAPDGLPTGRFLRKPYTPEQVADTLRELIGSVRDFDEPDLRALPQRSKNEEQDK
jgi:two-component system, response regulator PdtaR